MPDSDQTQSSSDQPGSFSSNQPTDFSSTDQSKGIPQPIEPGDLDLPQNQDQPPVFAPAADSSTPVSSGPSSSLPVSPLSTPAPTEPSSAEPLSPVSSVPAAEEPPLPLTEEQSTEKPFSVSAESEPEATEATPAESVPGPTQADSERPTPVEKTGMPPKEEVTPAKKSLAPGESVTPVSQSDSQQEEIGPSLADGESNPALAELSGRPPQAEGLPEVRIPGKSEPLPPSSPLEEKPKKGFFKKILVILLVLLLLGGAALGVYRFVLPQLGQEEEITLTYWGLWEPESVMRGIIQQWEEQNPGVKVVYQFNSPQQYRQRLQNSLASGQGPDLFRYHLTWVPMLRKELDPLPASVMSSAEFEANYYPVVASQLRSGTSYLGLPLMVDSLALFYNEGIFLAAGKSPPSSWEELRRLALELTVKDELGRIQTAGVALGNTSNVDHWSDILGLMMLQNGADLTDPGACSFQVEEEVCLGADALTFYTVFSAVDQVWDETLPNSTLAFSMGKLAMYFAPSWRVFDLKAANPSLDFKIVPVPQLPGTNLTWASFWVEGVSQQSQHKEAAWQFLKYLSSPQTLEKLYAAQSGVRLFGELYPQASQAQSLATNPLIAPFLTQLPQAQTWYLCSYTYDEGLNDKMIQYFANAVDAVNLGQPAKESLETAGQGVNQLLSQYGLAVPLVAQ